MRALFCMAALMIFMALPARAGDLLAVDLSSDHIDVTAGFNGAPVAVFGVRQPGGQVAVVLRGPARDMTVRRKESVLGAWINKAWVNFDGAPVYYDYALSAPEPEIAPAAVLKDSGIGVNSMDFKTGAWIDEKRKKEFLKALIRNKQEQGLYAREPRAVTALGPGFFRADFYLPANVPVGIYKVQTFYFNNGQVKDVQTKTLRVAQVGASAQILKFSRRNAFSYGALCVLLAVFAGWFSNRVRRKA